MKKQRYTVKATGKEVTVVGPIESDLDRLELRADTEFHDGTVRLLTYPLPEDAAPGQAYVLAFWGEEPPRMFNIPAGASMVKGEAGDFRIVLPEHLRHEFEIKADEADEEETK